MAPHRRPRIFNTPFESGVRSLILLTACYPQKLGLHRLVVLDHLVVHTADLEGPPSLHPDEASRAAEILVRRGLVNSGLDLFGTRNLISRYAMPNGFRYQAGEEAGSFVDLLNSEYTLELKDRAAWLAEHIGPLSDEELAELVRNRIDNWASEFLSDIGPAT